MTPAPALAAWQCGRVEVVLSKLSTWFDPWRVTLCKTPYIVKMMIAIGKLAVNRLKCLKSDKRSNFFIFK